MDSRNDPTQGRPSNLPSAPNARALEGVTADEKSRTDESHEKIQAHA